MMIERVVSVGLMSLALSVQMAAQTDPGPRTGAAGAPSVIGPALRGARARTTAGRTQRASAAGARRATVTAAR